MSGDEEHGNGGHGFFWFVIGVVFGIAGAIFAPRWVAPYLPVFLGGNTGIEGQVLEKVTEPDRMLVKVSAPDGLMLVTFTQNLQELDLLVQEGDSITLGLDGYETLVENPPVGRVIRPSAAGEPARLPSGGERQESAPGEATKDSAPAEPGTPGVPDMEAPTEEESEPPHSDEVTDAESEQDSGGVDASETDEDVR